MENRADGICISKNFYRYYANRVEALLPNDSFKYHLIEELMTMYNDTIKVANKIISDFKFDSDCDKLYTLRSKKKENKYE